MEIRELKANEWELYKKIRLESLLNDPQAFGSTYEETLQRSDDDWRIRVVGSKSPFSLKIFALEKGKPVGMMGLYQKEEDIAQGITNLFGVYVSPNFRGRGISKKLLNGLIDLAKAEKSIKKILLTVRHGQTPAESLYKSIGFVKYGENETGNSDLMELKIV